MKSSLIAHYLSVKEPRTYQCCLLVSSQSATQQTFIKPNYVPGRRRAVVFSVKLSIVSAEQE